MAGQLPQCWQGCCGILRARTQLCLVGPLGTVGSGTVHCSLWCHVCVAAWAEPDLALAAAGGWHGPGAGQRDQKQLQCRVLGLGCQHEADASRSCPTDSAERVVRRFQAPGVSNYTALLLSPDGGTLYLGAREMLLTLNTSNFQASSPVRRVSPGMGWAAPGEGGGTQLAGEQESPPHQHFGSV